MPPLVLLFVWLTRRAPAILSSVLHPNINCVRSALRGFVFFDLTLCCWCRQYGRVCSNVLGRDWQDDGTPQMPNVLRMLDALFLVPETENPVDTVLAMVRASGSGVVFS